MLSGKRTVTIMIMSMAKDIPADMENATLEKD
jgi:hypothetical protein